MLRRITAGRGSPRSSSSSTRISTTWPTPPEAKPFYNTNGIKEAVAEVVDNGSSFYTLSFYPTNKEWNGKYRKLKVDLDAAAESGVILCYPPRLLRRGQRTGGQRATAVRIAAAEHARF